MKQPMSKETREYHVKNRREEAPGVITLELEEHLPFESGQYINVYFPEFGTPEGKAYSLSSAPGEPLAITVRGIGEFSNRLCAMELGDAFLGSLPYGFFSPEFRDTSLVMIAAGIGITPFRAIIREAVRKAPDRPMWLFHSIRTSSDAVFKKEFETLKNKLPNLNLSYFITREGGSARRMTVEDMLLKLTDKEKAEFMICGSIPFVRDIWKGLVSSGISQDQIYTEAFFSH